MSSHKKYRFSDLNKDLDKTLKKMGMDKVQNKFSIEEICNYLNISKTSQKVIQNIPYKKISTQWNKENIYERTISLEDLKGVILREGTHNSWNWFEQLENLRFNKIKSYSKSFESMHKYLNEDALDQKEDLPIVLKYENEYFIHEGLHRLTISKCLGLEKFKVLVIDPELIEVNFLQKEI